MDFEQLRDSLSRHVSFKYNEWTIAKFKESECDGLTIKDFDKIIAEREGTTIIPTQIETKNNIILQNGLAESAKRDIGTSSTAIDYMSLGTNGTAESESHTDLQAELSGSPYVRRQLSTLGSRAVVNYTTKYGMLWTTAHVPSSASIPITIKEAGIHWHATDASKCHARVAFSDFALDAGDLLVVQINETMANGTV